MQTIHIKYLNPTNTKGTRLKAICDGGSVTIGRQYNLEVKEDAALAAKQLARKLEWTGSMVIGENKDGTYTAVFTHDHRFKI